MTIAVDWDIKHQPPQKIYFQYELVAELFTEPTTDQKTKPGGKVKALQKAPQGGNKQMRKTVGSQVRTLKKMIVYFVFLIG